MCLATGANTKKLDADLRTPGAQLGSIFKARDAVIQQMKAQADAVNRLDPDLKQRYKSATRSANPRAPMATTQMVAARDIMKEQERRDELRAANERLAQQRQAEVARVAEAQKQAEAQRQAEVQRQAQMQQQLEQDRQAQEQQIGRERVATQAVSASMQVLGRANQASTTAAPTAQVSRGTQSRTRVRSTSGSQTLRIGESSRATGVGVNIGG